STKRLHDGEIYELCEKDDMLFVMETFLEVITSLEKNEAITFVQQVMKGIGDMKKNLKIRWSPRRILWLALEFTADIWAAKYPGACLDLVHYSFIKDIKCRELLIHNLGTVRQTTEFGRLNKVHQLAIKYAIEFKKFFPEKPLRIIDAGVAAEAFPPENAAITSRELFEKVSLLFKDVTLFAIDRQGISDSTSALGFGILHSEKYLLPFDRAGLVYLEHDMLQATHPLPQNSAQIIIVANVITHLEDEAQTLLIKNAFKLLKPGGMLIFGFDENGYSVITKGKDEQPRFVGYLKSLLSVSELSLKIEDALGSSPASWEEIMEPYHNIPYQ
ncbi:MAG: class I SAM-dependent methyltransferase, partial [Candidatus Margulisiibacteriota bacterium]